MYCYTVHLLAAYKFSQFRDFLLLYCTWEMLLMYGYNFYVSMMYVARISRLHSAPKCSQFCDFLLLLLYMGDSYA